MMMPNEEILKKVTGDITDEVPEATIRLAATLFVKIMDKLVEEKAISYLGDDNRLKNFLDDNKQIREAVISFALAAILEFAPLSRVDDRRKRLAYNLRIRGYEEFGELAGVRLLTLLKLFEDKADRALSLANMYLRPDVDSSPAAREAAGEGHDSPEEAVTPGDLDNS